MKKSRVIKLCLALCLIYNSCEDSSESPEPSNELTASEISVAREAYQSPEAVFRLGNQSINSAAAVLEQTALLTGTLTTTGTLQESENGFSYSPQPTDKLVYQNQNGQNIASFTYRTIQGTINGNAEDFLSNNHEFEFFVDAPGQGTLEISSRNNGQLRSVRMDGTATHNGQDYDVNLLIEGTYYFEVDLTGAELSVDAQYTGTIRGKNFREEVDEQWKYNSVTASGQGGFVAENVYRSFNTAWTVEDRRFQYQDGVLQSVFRNGRPTEWDVNNSPWQANGTLLLNGQPIGNMTMGQEGDAIKVWLQLEKGKEELNSWRF